MVGFARPVRHTFAEYIELEEATTGKHEFLDGQIFAMAGGTPEHAALIASVVTQLSVQLRGSRCRAHASELRIRVASTGLATYPDASVICGPYDRDPENSRTVLNPSVVVEVLSPSTEAYDRGEKLLHYKRIPSLRSLLLVAHDRQEVEVWTRPDEGTPWCRSLVGPSDRATELLPETSLALDVTQLYVDAQQPET